MKRIFVFLLTLALAFGLVACGGDNNGGDTPIIPDNSDAIGAATVSVLTSSGAPLTNVFVFVYDKDGNTVGYSKTNNVGKASFNLSGSEYTVRLEGLPAGYVSQSYTLNSTELKIVPRTQLIPENQGAPSYKVGDVMQDFTFTDCDGNVVKLSDILKEKEAVVLNFWFINCEFCTKEFPYLNEAYLQYSDRIEVLGINVLGESDAKILSYKNKHSLDMPMGRENCGIDLKFGFTSSPATVIIDSDGIVRFSHVGAIQTTAEWCALFDAYLG